MLLLAAKCIDQDQLLQDANGNWVILGQMHNDTSIQGTSLRLSGELLDAQGNALASTTAPPCPEELSPNSLVVFELDFANSAGLHPSSYDVRPISGRALLQPLPALGATFSGFRGTRSGSQVTITGTIHNRQVRSGAYTGCLALYDSSGKVNTEVTIVGFGALSAGDTPVNLPFPVTRQGAMSARFWLVGPTASSDPFASDYQAAVTDIFPIY